MPIDTNLNAIGYFGKQIVPVNIWFDGKSYSASILNATILSDDLSTKATFFYELIASAEPNIVVANGQLTMDGQDYQNWGNNGDVNGEAYQWIAGQLNLQLQ